MQGYLQSTSAGQQSQDNIKAFIRDIAFYKLEKAEVLQLINVVPTSMVTLHSLIEQCDERFEEAQREHILEMVATYLLKNAPVEISEA